MLELRECARHIGFRLEDQCSILRKQPLDDAHIKEYTYGAPETGRSNTGPGDWPQLRTHVASSSRHVAPGIRVPSTLRHVPIRDRRSVSMQSGVSFDTVGTPETDALQPVKKKAAKQAAPLPGWEGENPRCQMCPKKKAFKATVFNGGMFCNKHTRKNMKEEQASKGHIVQWTDDHDATTTDLAMTLVYPTIPPLAYTGDGEDDWEFYQEQAHQNAVVKGFIDATNTRYTEAMGPDEAADEKEQHVHENFLKQQRDYDHKPYEEASIRLYTDHWIITRLRLLFLVILTYHRGGTSIYPVGGANNGYGEDRTLTMTHRIREITDILARDKRVVMDVIEGRGVAALASNPGKFEERKTSNFKCNAKKKRKLEASAGQSISGEHQHADGETTGSAPFLADNEDEVMSMPALESYATKRRPGPKRRKTQQTGPESSMTEQSVHEDGVILPVFDPLPNILHRTSALPVPYPDTIAQVMYNMGYSPVLPHLTPDTQTSPSTRLQQNQDSDAQYTPADVRTGETSLDHGKEWLDFDSFLQDPANQQTWGLMS
ncbi:hypothetical protein LTR78_009955 [Recurvomyces mirabilis]|uniref:Uncharacterized protein n=1 Tax=Recurvomyces mirabilis TaxID=574656 RepID=A0AAE0TN28_9PEZI|nr:hypothetical protein LTR78_009955 [Recurvomyces mirabilis]KAK5160387.1 hypothetical protein LTS14_001399 [Recurvomyces mirabilis]